MDKRRLTPSLRFSPPDFSNRPALTVGDGLIVLGLAVLVYVGARLALNAPVSLNGPDISLSAWALPWYACLSTGRMLAAYLLSLLFSLAYGYAAARSRASHLLLLPLLDVLQSVPILSFLPVVLLSLTALLPQGVAVELAAIILIFTSQAWNLTFSFYQSMTTLPMELREAAAVFRFSPWLRFKTLELPFAALGLIWNSVMSWAGGWFFLMAAEIFHVGDRDFRLPGLGSYLQTAANAGNLRAVALGLLTLVLIIVALDQFVWRPLLAWADKFKLEMTEGEAPPQSWFQEALSRSWLVRQFNERVGEPLSEQLDRRWPRDVVVAPLERGEQGERPGWPVWLGGGLLLAGLVYGGFRAASLLATIPVAEWGQLGLGLLATFLRVSVALVIALLWTVPVGVAIGMNRRLADILQPLAQIVAAVPATALFPIVLAALVAAPGGLNLAAVLLMLLGTQWYLLFNVIAGTAAIPQDLRYTTDLLQLSTWDRWRTLILPALFPYLVTGAITASGGAWNASIVAEHVQFGGQTYQTIGVGAVIAQATATGNYALLLAGTLALVLSVVCLNRFFWRRLYRLAEDRFRME